VRGEGPGREDLHRPGRVVGLCTGLAAGA